MFMARILNELKELDSFLKCPLCLEKCKNPVRIKVCGHYFCEECLKKFRSDHNCPECKSYYGSIDIDYNNIARQTAKHLTQLQTILTMAPSTSNMLNTLSDQNAILSTEPSTSNINRFKTSEENASNGIILYKSEKYHINFVDNTYMKFNAKGESPLHIACKKGQIDAVVSLINKQVDLNVKDNAGWAPLHEAVESQSLEVVKILLKNGALVNIPGIEFTTPLHKAVCKDNIEMIKLLLTYGADKNAIDYSGLKPRDCTKNDKIKYILENHTEKIEIIRQLFLTSRITVYCHSIDEECKNKLKKSQHIKVEDVLDIKRKISHILIKRSHKPSFKILIALLEGLQFIPQEAVDDFLMKNYFIPIPEYIFIFNEKLNIGIRQAMMSSLLKLPKLFDGISFFIEGHNSPVQVLNLQVDKEYLVKLIRSGNGHILYRAPALRTCEESFNHPFYSKEDSDTYRCCNYIIFQGNNPPELMYNMAELQHKSSEWLINCIINYEIC